MPTTLAATAPAAPASPNNPITPSPYPNGGPESRNANVVHKTLNEANDSSPYKARRRSTGSSRAMVAVDASRLW